MDKESMANGEDYLAHYGKLGMKWGKKSSKAPVHSSTDRKAVDKLVAKPVQSLSNKQIKSVNTRFEMEKKLTSFKDERTVVGRGQQRVALALGIAGTATAVYNLAKSPLAKAGYNAVKASLNK